MINAVQAFWNDTDIEILLKMNGSDIVEELEKMAETFSTNYIVITTDEEQVHFERMDERNVNISEIQYKIAIQSILMI